MKYITWNRVIIIAALVISAFIFAGTASATQHPKPNDPSAEAYAGADAQADAIAVSDSEAASQAASNAHGGNAASRAAGGDARSQSGSVSDGGDARSTNRNGLNAVTSVNGGGSSGNQTSFNSDFESLGIALHIPRATAAPEVGGHRCLEHLAGWNPLNLGGRTGKTRFDEDCMTDVADTREHQQCMDRVDLYAQLGRADLALTQLAQCDGVEFDPEPPVVSVTGTDNDDYVTKEEMERMFQTLMEK